MTVVLKRCVSFFFPRGFKIVLLCNSELQSFCLRLPGTCQHARMVVAVSPAHWSHSELPSLFMPVCQALWDGRCDGDGTYGPQVDCMYSWPETPLEWSKEGECPWASPLTSNLNISCPSLQSKSSHPWHTFLEPQAFPSRQMKTWQLINLSFLIGFLLLASRKPCGFFFFYLCS